MKKIYILTFQEAENKNFGAILQSFAVQNLLGNFEKNTKLIDYRLKKRNLLGKIKAEIEGKGFKEFHNKFLKKTKKITSLKLLKSLNKETDIFIVGSDQVWRKPIVDIAGFNFYFDFVDNNKKKIAYAASFGVDYWEGDEKLTEEIKPLIKRFDHISVREESGIDICKNTFGIDNVVCVLDPTLMIDKKDYQPILDDWKDKSHLKRKYIAHMFLDDTEQLKNGSKKIANYLGAEINYIKGKTLNIFGKTITLYNKVSQWLTYIKDAELVITDSFHCTVFSIIFHKKFIVVANQLRGIARLETLLKKVGLENRFFTNIDDVLESGILDKEIDYQEVDKRLDIHRKYSMEFLKKALED
ncbi:polysaccharide pyruvyl transferase family protein [Fusobacterium necrogenes]|uniref:polysaccharide pyruvyl transferase family protein n=1 Tax=Fusobacterium necrogenes TaxID=858 RepID=UPI00255C9B76|nr:polysaccharide pyruvyl transferase family protein [Fusobacterium necrogenes]